MTDVTGSNREILFIKPKVKNKRTRGNLKEAGVLVGGMIPWLRCGDDRRRAELRWRCVLWWTLAGSHHVTSLGPEQLGEILSQTARLSTWRSAMLSPCFDGWQSGMRLP